MSKKIPTPDESSRLADHQAEPFDLPNKSPIEPIEIALNDTIQFQCRKGIACFNKCCENIDITLTPYDIIRLKNRLGLLSKEFVAQYTVPYEMDHHGMPGLKMRTKAGSTVCPFVREEGCSVYEDRPAACRYYAVGTMGIRKKGIRKKDSPEIDDAYFIVKEDHCLGHFEPRHLSLSDYRKEQGVVEYDENNKPWRDIVIKKRSSGPTIGAPSARSMQLFDMCSYDIDSFRDFIQTDSFQEMFDIKTAEYQKLLDDENHLLSFAMRFLQQVLFGEQTIPLKKGARELRYSKRKEFINKRRQDEIEKALNTDPRYEKTNNDQKK